MQANFCFKQINEDKTKFILFHKFRDIDNLPVQLTVLKINNYNIER